MQRNHAALTHSATMHLLRAYVETKPGRANLFLGHAEMSFQRSDGSNLQFVLEMVMVKFRLLVLLGHPVYQILMLIKRIDYWRTLNFSFLMGFSCDMGAIN